MMCKFSKWLADEEIGGMAYDDARHKDWTTTTNRVPVTASPVFEPVYTNLKTHLIIKYM